MLKGHTRFRAMLGTSLALFFATHSAFAYEISGSVQDPDGQPIPGAVIQVMGGKQKVQTDEQGQFELKDLSKQAAELHIEAPYFSHENQRVNAKDDKPVTVTLTPAPVNIIDVTALPWHASNLESAMPVDVLSGDALRNQQAATLGETLERRLGVNTNYYGPVASSPIIRGLDGPRVKIAQNGLDTGDASRVGPDHVVATEASTAEQIEILRGPATLLFGSGASGGVVNIVDDRVPQDPATAGHWHLEHDTVADENSASASVTTGADSFAVHLDGFWRDSNDYRIPGGADVHANESHDQRLANSAYDASGYNLGGSYLLDQGFVGLSYGRLDRTYGIPGHDHGNGENVHANLEQDRWQLHSDLSFDHPLFSSLNTRIGYTDYRHGEIEGGTVTTQFANTLSELRADLLHEPLAQWRGSLTLHYKHQDFSAEGLEAFTPPSTTETLALALVEERHFGDLQVQLGARAERVKINADHVRVALNEDDHEQNLLTLLSIENQFDPFSLSAGAVWDLAPGYNLSASLTHSQRAPSAAELLSFGPHVGTGTYEVGALFNLHDEGGGHFHSDLNREPIELEKANNLELSLSKYRGDIGLTLNAFYNRIDNFYYLQASGLTAENEHAHDHGDDHGHEETEGLPVYAYTAKDAHLYGFEGEVTWRLNSAFKLTGFSDYTRASLRDGDDLPRIPPLRAGLQLNFEQGPYTAELSTTHYAKQTKTAASETQTDGYTLLDAQVGYEMTLGQQRVMFYLQGSNLTNEEARPHTSFLKDKAPLPARSFAAGIRSTF